MMRLITILLLMAITAQAGIWEQARRARAWPYSIPQSLYTNLVAWYPMTSDPSNSTPWQVVDSSTYANTGTQTNSAARPAWSALNSGSLVFDASDDFVRMSAITGTFYSCSIVGVVKRTSASANQAIFGIGDTSGDANRAGVLLTASGNSLRYYYIPANTGFAINYETIPSITVPGSVYFHFAFSINTNQLPALYINGVSQTLTNVSVGSGADLSYVHGIGELGGAKITTVGTRINNGSFGLYFGGNVGDFEIYNRAITATEVTNLFINSKSRFGL